MIDVLISVKIFNMFMCWLILASYSDSKDGVLLLNHGASFAYLKYFLLFVFHVYTHLTHKHVNIGMMFFIMASLYRKFNSHYLPISRTNFILVVKSPMMTRVVFVFLFNLSAAYPNILSSWFSAAWANRKTQLLVIC